MLRALIALPFLLVLVLFAFSNRQPVTLGIWPTDFAVTVPLSIAILAAMASGFPARRFVRVDSGARAPSSRTPARAHRPAAGSAARRIASAARPFPAPR